MSKQLKWSNSAKYWNRKPGILVGDLGAGLENLLKNIKKLLPVSRQVTINVLEVQNADLDANLLADLVAEQLEKRIALEELFGKHYKSSKTECKWNKNPSFRTFEWSWNGKKWMDSRRSSSFTNITCRYWLRRKKLILSMVF
jgi:hypothetical protein